jgi:glycosyltransferase involved in cell wall biosynthesis
VSGKPPVVLDVRVLAGTGGGPDKTILNSPRFLTRAGYRMLCAYMHPPGDPAFAQLTERAAELGAPLLSVIDRGPWDWTVIGRLLAICRRERVAIWHGHDYKSNVLGLLLRPFCPMRLVTTVHGWVKHTRRTPLYYKIDELCLPHYESVICVSDDLVARCRKCRVPVRRCVLIENGIDTEQYRRGMAAAEAKARLGLPPDRFLIGGVGRLSAEKGFDLLIRAGQQLLAAGHELGLVIVGEGEERPRLEALTAELGLGARVRLTGYCADPRPLYEAMDLFVLSSLREGLPNVVLEALALEVPIVATRVAGVPRLIQDGVDGMLVEPGSPEMLAQAIAVLLSDPGLRARLAQAGRHTVETRFSFAVRMQKIAGLYDRLLEKT